MTTLVQRVMTKPQTEHHCPRKLTKSTMMWRPVELLAFLYPETAQMVLPLKPAIAAYCPWCGDIWVVVQHA